MSFKKLSRIDEPRVQNRLKFNSEFSKLVDEQKSKLLAELEEAEKLKRAKKILDKM